VSWWLLLLILTNLALATVVSLAWLQWRRERARLAAEFRHYLDGTEKRLDAAVGQCQAELETAGKAILARLNAAGAHHVARLRAEAAEHLASLQQTIDRILVAVRPPPR
jgi:hypothetical protein